MSSRPPKTTGALGHQAGRERPVTVTGNADLDVASLAGNSLGIGAVARILRGLRLPVAGGISQLGGHLGTEATLESLLDQRGDEATIAGEFDFTGTDLREEFVEGPGGLQLVNDVVGLVRVGVCIRHSQYSVLSTVTRYTNHLTPSVIRAVISWRRRHRSCTATECGSRRFSRCASFRRRTPGSGVGSLILTKPTPPLAHDRAVPRYFKCPQQIYAVRANTFRVTAGHPPQIATPGHTFCRLTP